MMVLQFNDPDAFIWIAIYGLAAALCLLAALGLRVAPLVGIALVICLAWSLWLSPHILNWLANHAFEFIVDEASVDIVYMEKARESLGLFIAVSGLILAWFAAGRRPENELL